MKTYYHAKAQDNFNALCLTGDAHREFNNNVTCPYCLATIVANNYIKDNNLLKFSTEYLTTKLREIKTTCGITLLLRIESRWVDVFDPDGKCLQSIKF